MFFLDVFIIVACQGLTVVGWYVWHALYMYGFQLRWICLIVWPRTGHGPRELALSNFVGNGRKPLSAVDFSQSYLPIDGSKY